MKMKSTNKRVHISALMVALVGASAVEAALSIDFGTATSPVQAGFEAYTGADEDLSSFTTQTYTAFDTDVTVLVGWTNPLDKGAKAVNRTDGDLKTSDAQDALRDYFATDGRSGEAPDSDMTVTLGGLPAGEYSWTSITT
jgi:hypothetical protein